MQLILAVLSTVAIIAVGLAICYFMVMLGWILAIGGFGLLLFTFLYSAFTDSSDKNKGP